MLCRELERQVLALVEDELPSSRREELEAHLRQCDRCASLVSDFKVIVSELRAPQGARLSPYFWPRLHQRVREHDAREADGRGRVSLTKLRLRPAALAACLLFGLWGGSLLGDRVVERLRRPADEDELLPFAAVLDDVPRGSLAELLAEELLPEDILEDEGEP